MSETQVEFKWVNRLDLALAAQSALSGVSNDNREDLQASGFRVCVWGVRVRVRVCGRESAGEVAA